MKLFIETAFEDHRGKISDLLVGEAIDGVSLVTFTPGAVRANHYHKQTTQWTYVAKGTILYASQLTGAEKQEAQLQAGDFVVSRPNEAHAYKAITEAEILVFTKGPRVGFDYEKDTFRLDDPLIPT